MKFHRIFPFKVVSFIVVILISFSCTQDKTLEIQKDKRIKAALRSVANQLLLSQQDSLSVILPVIKISESTYEISFENPIAFDTAALSQIINATLKKAQLTNNYLVEVIQCQDREVAYSYEMLSSAEENIVPCNGRIVPKQCYIIQLAFISDHSVTSNAYIFYLLVFLVLAFLVVVFYSKYYAFKNTTITETTIEIGSFVFFPEEHKLLMEASEISLSNKECEILKMLVAKPNQIIKREELSKRVWEKQGVIVGRSLDPYISKLRNKLQDDTSVKIVDVHGVGYRLEIN